MLVCWYVKKNQYFSSPISPWLTRLFTLFANLPCSSDTCIRLSLYSDHLINITGCFHWWWWAVVLEWPMLLVTTDWHRQGSGFSWSLPGLGQSFTIQSVHSLYTVMEELVLLYINTPKLQPRVIIDSTPLPSCKTIAAPPLHCTATGNSFNINAVFTPNPHY